MEITPVISVDGIEVSTGIQGNITQEIHKTYMETVTGKREHYINWLTPIYVKNN